MTRLATTTALRMPVPAPRGPLSAALVEDLRDAHADPDRPALRRLADDAVASAHRRGGVLADDDVQVSLLCLQELHYRGLQGVPDDVEWQPGVVAARRVLEGALEAELRERVTLPPLPAPDAASVAATLFEMTSGSAGPSVARFAARKATLEQLREILVLKSVYQLKEADPHTWAIPRLSGRAKAAAVEIQADEYGGGHLPSMHSELFRTAMRALDLDDSYGAYVSHAPAITLCASTFMSMCGLARRLRGAISGHLAAFEMTSSIPNKQYGDGLRRHGLGTDATHYFDEHVEADAVHEQIAGRDLAGGLAEAEPELVGDIVFGAAACLFLDDLAAAEHLGAWESGRSALREAIA